MNIIELLECIGINNVHVQGVHNSIDGQIKTMGKGKNAYTRLTIGTTEVEPIDFIAAPRKLGLILWFEKDRYDNAVAAMDDKA